MASAIIEGMAQLVVRRLDESIVRALKVRAAQRGRSAEEEHREILRHALLEPGRRKSFKAHLLAMPNVGRDSDFDIPRRRGRRVEL